MAEGTTLVDTGQQEEEKEQDDRIFFTLLERAGTMGGYQCITVIIMCLIGYLCGGLMLITPYLFYQDPYVCEGPVPGGQTCFDYVCSLPADQRYPFVPTEAKMSTLSTKFGDYRCDEQHFTIALIITIMYVGNVVGFLGLTLVGDLMGRKMLLVANLFLVVVGLMLVILCQTLIMAGVGLFIITCGVQNAFNVCFYFIAETMSEEYREKFSVAIQLFYGLGVLMNVLWYWWLADWQLIFVAVYFAPLVVVIGGSIFYMRDTPMCLVTRYPSDWALKDFTFIASQNNKKDFNLTLKEIRRVRKTYEAKLQGQIHEKKHTFSVLDLFRYNSLRMMTLMLIVLQCTIIFEFYAPALMLDEFKMDLFINGLVVGVSQIISYPICYYMITRIRRRTVAYGCYFLTFACSMVLVFIWKQGSTEEEEIGSSIGVLALIFVFRFAISVQYTYFYVYYNELYPTQVRVLGTGLVSLMGGVMVTVAPQIIDLCISSGFPIMIIFAVLSGLSFFFSSRLPETLGAAPHDEIKELRDMHVEVSISSESLISSDNNLDSPLLAQKKLVPKKVQSST